MGFLWTLVCVASTIGCAYVLEFYKSPWWGGIIFTWLGVLGFVSFALAGYYFSRQGEEKNNEV